MTDGMLDGSMAVLLVAWFASVLVMLARYRG